MKKRIISVTTIFTIVLIGGLLVIFLCGLNFDVDFATEVTIKIKYGSVDIEEKITDDLIIAKLKSIFKGSTFRDGGLSCGFSTDVSFTFSNGKKVFILCPAIDSCPVIKIADTTKNLKITEENRKMLNDILYKYGFPEIWQ